MGWLLHLSDLHLGDGADALDDDKAVFDEQVDLETAQTVLRQTLDSLSRFVEAHGKPALAVVSGDIAIAAHESGFAAFRELLRSDLLPEPERVVVVPGNHDVVWDAPQASPERYSGFLSATRELGCVTPLLDGIDFDVEQGQLTAEGRRTPHLLETDELLIVPLNTSNYCGVTVTPRGGWTEAEWHGELQTVGADTEQILRQLRKLHQQDVPRMSRAQITALGQLVQERGDDSRVRVAVLHHQLLPVSAREERKPFETLVNLGLVRELLDTYSIDLVLHGHKHESGIYWDVSGGPASPYRRTAVIAAPGAFAVGKPVMRAIMVEPPLAAPSITAVTFGGASASRKNPLVLDTQRVELWTAAMESERRDRVVVAGHTRDITYARLRALFEATGGAPRRNLVCEIDDPAEAAELPADYPPVAASDAGAWFAELVSWWQRADSELVRQGLVPFNHGSRIRRRWGDQVDRAVRMLNERADSSRALIQLVSPKETGRYRADERDLKRGSYPAFVLAELSIVERDGRELDCFAYFRKQEMRYWWPVNVAELARLQSEIAAKLKVSAVPGRIVTFSAAALWKDALPAVAVPVADLLVEQPERLLAMAIAVAFSTNSTPDWDLVVADLCGEGQTEPSRPQVGLTVLLDHLARLEPVAASPRFEAVRTALQELVEQHGALAGADLNPTAIRLLEQRAKRLAQALRSEM